MKMMRFDNRTLGLIILVALIVIVVFNPDNIVGALSLIRDASITLVALMGAMYLWKRM
jgi:hypothetical protein